MKAGDELVLGRKSETYLSVDQSDYSHEPMTFEKGTPALGGFLKAKAIEKLLHTLNRDVSNLELNVQQLHQQKQEMADSHKPEEITASYICAHWERTNGVPAAPINKHALQSLCGGTIASLISPEGSMRHAFSCAKNQDNSGSSFEYQYEHAKGLLDVKKRERGKVLSRMKPVKPSRPRAVRPWEIEEQKNISSGRRIILKQENWTLRPSGTTRRPCKRT